MTHRPTELSYYTADLARQHDELRVGLNKELEKIYRDILNLVFFFLKGVEVILLLWAWGTRKSIHMEGNNIQIV